MKSISLILWFFVNYILIISIISCDHIPFKPKEKNRPPETYFALSPIIDTLNGSIYFSINGIDYDGEVDSFKFKIENSVEFSEWQIINAKISETNDKIFNASIRLSIPPGDYILVIKSVDNEGKEDPTPEKHSFAIPTLQEVLSEQVPLNFSVRQSTPAEIVTATETVIPNSDGTFKLNKFQPIKQTVLIRKEEGRINFLYYVPPPKITLSQSSPLQKFVGEEIKITPESTVLALIMLNPYLIEASDEDRVRIAESALQNPKLAKIARNIAQLYKDNPYTHERILFLEDYPNGILEGCFEILQESMISTRSKITSSEPPFIKFNSGNEVTLVNTKHIYYGTLTTASSFSRSILLRPRDGIFDYNFWPPKVILAGNIEETISLPKDRFRTNITKGFDREELLQNPLGHSALATYANVGEAIEKIISLAVAFDFELSEAIANHQPVQKKLMKIIVSVRNKDTGEVVSNTIDLIADNKDIIRNAAKEYLGDNAEEYIGDILAVITGINFALKVAKAADSIPFFYDMVAAPSDIDYYYSLKNNTLNYLPVFENIGKRYISENSTLVLEVKATDLDNDVLSYTASNLPDGAKFEGQTLTWNPTYDQSGAYQVTFTVNDGSDLVSETIDIQVNNTNRPPKFNPIDNKIVDVDETLRFTVTAVDPDNNISEYRIVEGPEGANIRYSDGRFRWTPNQNQVGVNKITFEVRDYGGASDLKTIWVTVKLKDNAPYTPRSPFPSDQATGQPLSILLKWSGGDPDIDDEVTYDVYFGTDSTLDGSELVSRSQVEPSYSLYGLAYDTRYYWKVIARDNHGNIIEGPIWEFETESKPSDEEDKSNTNKSTLIAEWTPSEVIYGELVNLTLTIEETSGIDIQLTGGRISQYGSDGQFVMSTKLSEEDIINQFGTTYLVGGGTLTFMPKRTWRGDTGIFVYTYWGVDINGNPIEVVAILKSIRPIGSIKTLGRSSSFYFADTWIDGLTYDGLGFWLIALQASSGTPKKDVHRIIPGDLSPIESFHLNEDIRDLAFHEGFFYGTDGTAIYKYDTSFNLLNTSTLLSKYHSLNELESDNEYLWGYRAGEFIKFDANFNIIDVIELANYYSLSGLVFDGSRFWSVSSEETKLFKHAIDDMSILESYEMPLNIYFSPISLSYKNGSLWLLTNLSSIKSLVELQIDYYYPTIQISSNP